MIWLVPSRLRKLQPMQEYHGDGPQQLVLLVIRTRSASAPLANESGNLLCPQSAFQSCRFQQKLQSVFADGVQTLFLWEASAETLSSSPDTIFLHASFKWLYARKGAGREVEELTRKDFGLQPNACSNAGWLAALCKVADESACKRGKRGWGQVVPVLKGISEMKQALFHCPG